MRRREIFRALVEAQDEAITEPESRKALAERFDVGDKVVRRIAREGLDKHWPPL